MLNKVTVMLLVALIGVWGCADDSTQFETNQVGLSGISDQDGQILRDVLHKFQGTGPSSVNVTTVLSTVVSECLRNFAGAFSNESLVVKSQTLDLTASGVLPKSNAFGDYDPSGGFIEFLEISVDADTDQQEEDKVYKRAKEFKSGAVDDFDFSRTKDSPDGYSLHDREEFSLAISEGLEYEETLWDQVVSYTEQSGGEISGREYAYNSHPVLTVTLDAGAQALSLNSVDDLLESAQGWSTTTVQQNDYDLSGTLTLYQPKKFNAEPNTNPEAELDSDTTTEDGLEVTTSTVTTVSKAEEAGPTPELITTTQVTRTSTNIQKVEPPTAVDPARTVFEQAEEHVTSEVVYSVAPGQGAEALRQHAAEKYKSHVVTERTITTVETAYEGPGENKFERTTTVEVYRHTDNPATRNDIAQWKSTRTQNIQTVDRGEDFDETRRGGTEWLTDQIQVDPDFDAVSFVWDGGVKFVSISEGRYFGADSAGFETSTVDETQYSISAGFDASSIEISGSYARRSASISNGNGQAHSIDGDLDGSLSVGVDDASYTISAEEWEGWLKP